MILAAACLASAGAVTPGGLRLEDGVPVRSLRARQVWVWNPGDADVLQTLVRGQYVGPRWGVDGELPFVHTWARGWSDTGLGQLRLGVRHWFGTLQAPVSVGLETSFPIAPRTALVVAWGSLSRETLRAFELSWVATYTFGPEHPTTIRLAAGTTASPFLGGGSYLGPLLVGELAAVHVHRVAEQVGVGLESELVVDLAWWSARTFVRLDRRAGSVDLGLQVPLSAIYEQGALTSLQLVVQGRTFFP